MSSLSLDLRSFKIPLGKLAQRERFCTRQGTVLSYRLYPAAWSEDLIVLYHGVGSDSRYLCVLASALAAAGKGIVVTPDFRGHGESLAESDLISPGQLEVDLEELIIHLKMTRALSRITLAGHSLGGGFALRIAVSDLSRQFVKYIALAPYLPPMLGAFHEGFGGWVTPQESGFVVNMPEAFKTGQEKLKYSDNYLKAATTPNNILELLKTKQPPVQVLTGAQDEVVNALKQQELFTMSEIPFTLLPGLNHLSIVAKPQDYLDFF